MSTQTEIEKANERVRIFEQLSSAAEVLNGLIEQHSKDSKDRETLKLASRALFFVLVRRLDEFIEFQAEINRQDAN
jgi:hypothetical protein